ncbi:zinc finger protein 618 isoform X4 [Rana temporaria]|uniref:zinc finger protein 618 isoform X4 n=1 Tax=Rana temporaria TaxID=8407 RepID=UPI001AAD2058|nr:zinc finger protein 618 isoform X4 [Rana temporaria]
MTTNDVMVKKEKCEEEVQNVAWEEKTKIPVVINQIGDGPEEVPAEICVVIGENRIQQNVGENSPDIPPAAMNREASWSGGARPRNISPRISTSSPGSYECGICRKKYKYYNCFQTHVRAHIDNEAASVEGASQGKTGNYMCEFCGKQYKYYTPYQEHVALHTPLKSAFTQDIEAKQPNNYEEANSNSQHSSAGSSRTRAGMSDMAGGAGSGGGASWKKESPSPMISSPFPVMQGKGWKKKIKRKEENNKLVKEEKSGKTEEPYTCGACGIQFQFYNNLLEHMQSHAADENSIATNQSRSLPPPPEENWKTQPQRNNANNSMSQVLEEQGEAVLSKTIICDVLSSGCLPTTMQGNTDKRNQKPTTTTTPTPPVTTPVAPINNSLPEKERQHIAERLLRVMCADLGALSVLNGKDFFKLAQTLVDTGARYGTFSVNEILGNMNNLAMKHLPRMYNQVKVKVTCALGGNICLGIGVTCHSQSIGSDSCYVLTAYQAEGHQIKRYVLGIKDIEGKDSGEFIHQWVQNVLSEFVMSEIRTVYVTDCKVNSSAFSKVGTCLRCSACSLNSVVQSVLNKRTLQARNMHEVIELLNVTEELAGAAGIVKETFGSLEESSPPPCWNSVTDSLLLVHERYEQICEFYSRAKKLNIIQNLNKHLLSNLAAILSPVKQAVIDLSNERKPTLQLVLPTYVRLEKLFTSKANDAGIISKLCHLFLEALKENFKVESAHKVAMILDPQQKLRPVPPYQHEEIITKVCELINEVRDGVEESEFVVPPKKARQSSESTKVQDDDRMGKNEVYDYLQEPLFQVTPDLFHFWSSVTQKHTRLSKLAFWLLAVPAVGARSECVNMCEQTMLIKRRRLLSPEDINKVMFLKSNML